MSGETPSRPGRAVDEDRSASDRKLDETLEETFPASDALATAAIDAADAEGLRFVAACPFVKAFLRKHSHHDTPSETDRP